MEVIQFIISKPLAFDDINQMLGPHKNKTWVIRYEELKQFKSLEEMFSTKTAAIIFLDIHGETSSSIGHWITVLKHKDHYEHFDSYGISVDEENHITKEPIPYLSNLFSESKIPIVDSGRKLQAQKEDVNTCGRYCVARVHLQKYELKTFYKFLDIIGTDPDRSITLMTMLLY